MPRIAAILTSLALTAAFGATAFAQAPPTQVRIRGTVTSLTGNVLTVAGAASSTQVTLPDNVRATWVQKVDLSTIAPNSYIGVVAVEQPDGTLRANVVQVFPEAQRGVVPEGTRPWDTSPNASMTNATVTTIASATVDKVTGRMLSVKYKDTQKNVFVPPNAAIVTFIPADKAAITPGAHVIVNATKAADGALTVTNVQVGKDGFTPPM